MCQYFVTQYACEHALLHDTKKCAVKLTAGPFEHFPSCENTEVLRRAPGNCNKCKADLHERQRNVHSLAQYSRENSIPSWKRKLSSTKQRIFAPLAKILEEFSIEGNPHEASMTQVPVAVSAAARPATLTKPRSAPKPVMSKHPHPTVTTATARKSVPYPAEAVEQPARSGNSLWSWSVNDDLPWQKVASTREEDTRPVSPKSKPEPASVLDTLPSQQHPLRQNKPECAIGQYGTRQRRSSPPPIKSEVGDSHLGGKNGWKVNTPAVSSREPFPKPPVKNSPVGLTGTQRRGKEPVRRQPLPASAASLWNSAQTSVSQTKLSSAEQIGYAPYSDQPRGKNPTTRRQPLPASAANLWESTTVSPPASCTAQAILTGNRRSRADQQNAELFFDEKFNTETKGDRRSRVDEQDLELFLAGFATINETMEVKVEGKRTPTVLRAGRRDMTYKSPTVGQIPSHYSRTITTQKSKTENRKAHLTPTEREMWTQYIAYKPPAEPPAQEFVGGKRMSNRISRPGLHDFYTSKEALRLQGGGGGPELPTATMTGGKKDENQPRRSRLQEPELQSEWDRVVLRAMVSRETVASNLSSASFPEWI